MAKIKEKSSYSIQFSDGDNLAYFLVDVKELFDITLNYPGILNALRIAFKASKPAIPYMTGLLRSSYTMDRISNTTVRVYFDPDKLIGKTRLGRKVKEYYPKYLKEHQKTFGWMDWIIRKFLTSLIIQVKEMNKKKSEREAISMIAVMAFLTAFNKNLKEKIDKENKLKKDKEGRRNGK